MEQKTSVLWIVNMMLPELAQHLGLKTGSSGTWMFDLSRKLVDQEGCRLAIACIYGDHLKKYEVNGITYYTLPGKPSNMYFYTKRFEIIWKQINEEFKPDLVHIHGTEYSHGLSFLRMCPNVPALLTIQGVMEKISNAAFDGISKWQAVLYNTRTEWLHFSGMYMNNVLRKFNLKYEREIVGRVKFATGRTDWDKAFLHGINPNIEYFRVFYNLRDEFYSTSKWSVDNIERHTIYGSTSAQAVLKGGHILLKALSIVVKKYPDAKVIFLNPGTKDGTYSINNGYGKIIARLIKEYHLENNIECIPAQNTEGVIKNMKRCHCAVIPSAMENASATLREAMHLGVPSFAAYRGGMAELIDEGVDGFLYDFSEAEVLASKICELFANDELAKTVSQGAINKATIWHDRIKNPKDMENVYRYILSNINE